MFKKVYLKHETQKWQKWKNGKLYPRQLLVKRKHFQMSKRAHQAASSEQCRGSSSRPCGLSGTSVLLLVQIGHMTAGVYLLKFWIWFHWRASGRDTPLAQDALWESGFTPVHTNCQKAVCFWHLWWQLEDLHIYHQDAAKNLQRSREQQKKVLGPEFYVKNSHNSVPESQTT